MNTNLGDFHVYRTVYKGVIHNSNMILNWKVMLMFYCS